MSSGFLRLSIAATALLTGTEVALCQGQAPGSKPADTPETAIYGALFQEVATLERMADDIAAKGKDSKAIRFTIRKDAKLTDGEDTALNKIANQCNARIDDIRKRQAPLVNEGRNQLAANPGREPSVVSQLNALDASRRATLRQCVDQVRVAFGPLRFAEFDAWVKTTIAPKIKTFAVPLPVQPSKP